MQFKKYSTAWYSIALDTEKQVFIANDKAQPEFQATGVTIEEAIQNLQSLEENSFSKLT
ncbi:hypothetical protein PLO_1594 [Pediococcus acidilactici NGRI 0510Q]|uniref:hypothetical protein n=1 Tax=Pediococcus acidilactici TaxID=1254 RepID=UPI00029E7BE5|nr:hypothetical protein [Pediococcus acidilactici]KRN91430.1 hypothetical protein IV82_GL000774 [Pediococcus acidilactici]QQC13734.1 hypothetical protein I6H64_07030 [Pediococcus acidilactici]GAC46122.1 hypothetical protein PLO_1594 [Pediococcus acidilactici NGRI 0510Q]